MKFYHHEIKKPGVHTFFWFTSGKQMSYYYGPCFYRIDFVFIPSYIEHRNIKAQGITTVMSTVMY